jgi:hypothetical protein
MFKPHFHVYRAPDGDSGSGGDDRGDNWTPTEGVDDAAAALVKPVVAVVDDEPPPKAEKPAAKTTLAAVADDADADAEAAADAAQAAQDVADEAAGKPKRKENRLPLSRVNEMIAKEREARAGVEAELAKYKQGATVADVNAAITATETKLVELEKTYAQHVVDGAADKAAAVMTEIRRTERAINEKSSELRETAAVARAVESVRYGTTVERLEATYPALNEDHADYDKGKAGEVVELMNAYKTQGYAPSAALQKAVKLIMPPVTKAQEAATEVEARVDPKAVEAARKAAAVVKTAETIAKTPASAAKTGLDSDKSGGGALSAKEAIKMSHKDFSALNDETLATMRGDVL